MKKFSKIFIILILMMLPKSVFAYDYEHILLVEKFNVSSSDITLEGYSYISHQDNYGVKNGKGNLKTYILVYKGSWNSAYADIATCDSNVNCLSFKTDVVARDMWWARCTDESCLNWNNSMQRADNKSLINDDSCVDASNTCLYYNVGFKKTISLSTIMNNFSNNEGNVNEEIGFRIVSVAFKNDGSSVARTVNSGVAVHTDICYVNGAKCNSNSNNVNSGDYSFQLDEFSKTVNYDASISIPRKENGDRVGNIDPVDGFIPVAYFLENKQYDIKSFKLAPQEITVKKGGKKGTFKDSLIQLESETSPDNYKETGCKAVVPAGYTGDSGAGTSPYDYWTLANFVTFNGDLKLRGLKLNVVTVNCDVFEDSSKSSNEINCDSSGKYKQCVSKEINATIYVKSISNSCKNSGSINKTTINGSLYVPVNINTDVLFNQEATFTFGNITPDSVRAGKAFSLGSTSYSNKVTWMNAKMYENSKKPYYKYDYKDADYLNGSCSLMENLNINDVSGNNKYCYAKDGGGHECGNDLMTISLLAINQKAGAEVKINDVAKNHMESNISFISCNSNDSSGCYNGNATEPIGGIWNIIGDVVDEKFSYDGHERGRIVTQNFNYSLYDSYVSLFGDNAGEVIYSDGSTSYSETEYYKGVNKYYVDFKYANFIWPFDLNGESNPSFVNSMVWSLKGTCDVNVEEGYYDIPGDPEPGGPEPGNPEPGDPGIPNTSGSGFLYRYRSISLSRPFPNANGDFSNIAPNWKDWFKDTTNQKRISGTYDTDKVPIYKIKIDKGVTFSGSDYTSMENINPEGDSTFIDDTKFEEITTKKSYCPVGYFIGDDPDSCDEY